MTTIIEPVSLELVERLNRDLVKASTHLGRDEARYMVDSYYDLQEYRKASANRERAASADAEPHELISWLTVQTATLEKQIQRALGAWAADQPAGAWAQSITGIGPVISAGLLAHIDIRQAPTAGHIWRFAGLDPTVTWGKGEKRPWNASLKRLCWLIGESFVKVQAHENDYYGKLYIERRAKEDKRNERGDFAEQAAAILERKNIGKDKEAYKAYAAGKLPPAHIYSRAKRWTVKLFLSHYHHVAYEVEFGGPPSLPYILTQEGGHAHYLAPPGWN